MSLGLVAGCDGTNPDQVSDSLSALTSLDAGVNDIRVNHEGRDRRLLIATPEGFDGDGGDPALLAFHGAGGKADGPFRRFRRFADKRDIIVISVEAVQPFAKWNFKDGFHRVDYNDVGLVRRVVETMVSLEIVDPKTVYATGHSSGGLFTYRLAKETSLFAAVAPMSCGMAKGAHEPDVNTTPISLMQVIGDEDKSYHGSSNPRVTMYSAKERMEIWRTFNDCDPDANVTQLKDKITISTYSCPSGIEVALAVLEGQGHLIERHLRRPVDVATMDFLLSHRKD